MGEEICELDGGHAFACGGVGVVVWRIEVEAAEDAAAVVTEDEGAAGDALGAFGGGGLDEVLEVCDVAGIDFFGEVEGGVVPTDDHLGWVPPPVA